MPGFYTSLDLPVNISEKEAIEYIKTNVEGRKVAINFVGLKTIWITPNEETRYTYYPPKIRKIRYTKRYMIPSKTGHDIGKTYYKI